MRSRIENRKKQVIQQKTVIPEQKQMDTARDRRKKILEYKKQQSRYKLPKIDPNDSIQDIKRKVDINELNRQWNEEFDNKNNDNDTTNENKTSEAKTNDNSEDTKNDTSNNDISTQNGNHSQPNTDGNNDDNKETNETNGTSENKTDANNDNSDGIKMKISVNDTPITNDGNDSDASFASMISVEELVLTPQAEETMAKLEEAFEVADPDYFGFIDWDDFLKILKDNGVEIPKKDLQMFAKAVQMIGILYNIFIHILFVYFYI